MIDISALSGGQMVSYYLMASYLYYQMDEASPLSDCEFDRLCARLLAEWKTVKHPHKKVIVKGDLSAGSGFSIPLKKYPLIVQSAAWQWQSSMKGK